VYFALFRYFLLNLAGWLAVRPSVFFSYLWRVYLGLPPLLPPRVAFSAASRRLGSPPLLPPRAAVSAASAAAPAAFLPPRAAVSAASAAASAASIGAAFDPIF
jgi:hypothetical protein